MLTRDERVLLVRRSPRLRAFPDLWVFPGGTLSKADWRVPVRGAADRAQAARIAAAAREAFEETGVFLGRGNRKWPAAVWEECRRELLAGKMDLAGFLERVDAEVDAADFALVEQRLTPESAPFRFDAHFYRLPMPEGAAAAIWPGEIVEAVCLAPNAALSRWRRGELALAPPIIGLLERWSSDDTVFRERNRAAGRIRPVVRYSPGIGMIPCRTPTLPPATHTNALLIGASRRYLVDPAPEDPAEREALFEKVDRMLGPADRLEAVLVTHHHRDHIGSVAAAAARYGVPVGAHPETLARMPPGLDAPVMRLVGGEKFDLGTAPDGSPGWTLAVRFTPGHSPGHLSFVESRYGAMAVGDMVSSLSSILISSEDGDLAQYLDSLRRLAGECRGFVYPGHGVPVAAGRSLLERQIRHREAREASLLAALGARPQDLEEIGLKVYSASEIPETGPSRKLALTALTAGLVKLRGEGRALVRNGKWSLPAGYGS